MAFGRCQKRDYAEILRPIGSGRRGSAALYLYQRGEVEVSDKKKDNDKKKKKKKKSVLEAEILSFMQKSMKTALDLALDDLFKDWK